MLSKNLKTNICSNEENLVLCWFLKNTVRDNVEMKYRK